jgi:hypothetical protein
VHTPRLRLVVGSHWGRHDPLEHSGLKVEEGHQVRDGKATPRSLTGRLAEGLLKGGHIWH